MNIALITAGIHPAPRKSAPGRVIVFGDPIKPGPRPRDEALPRGIRPGTRAAQIWRVLPDADDIPLCMREIARDLRISVGVVGPALTAMHERGLIDRYGDAPGYGYTRPENALEAA